MKSRMLKIAVPAVLIIAALLLIISASGGPGTRYTDGDRVGRIVSKVDGSAEYSSALSFKEGDPSHEADHIFDAFDYVPGVERVELDVVTGTIYVAYDPAAVTEQAIVAALTQFGYPPVTN